MYMNCFMLQVITVRVLYFLANSATLRFSPIAVGAPVLVLLHPGPQVLHHGFLTQLAGHFCFLKPPAGTSNPASLYRWCENVQ